MSRLIRSVAVVFVLAACTASVLDRDQEFLSGSRVTVDEPTPRQIENLVLLGQVWGFLKYHHPAVTGGRFHWDFELFRVLPDVLAAADDDELGAAFVDWLDRIGRPEDCDPCAELVTDDLHLMPPIDWIRDEVRLGTELSQRLVEIHANRSIVDPQFYVGLEPRARNPSFRNELAYRDVELPDPGYQLLALFRAWNVAQWWFPYRDVIDEDWVAVLAESIPPIMGAPDADAYARELMAFIARMDDGHAGLWSAGKKQPPVGECIVPVAWDFVEGRPVVKSFMAAEQTDLWIGDVLVAIDGVPVEEIVDAVRRFHPGSNSKAVLKSIGYSLGRGDCGVCQVTVERDVGQVDIAVERMDPSTLDRTVVARNSRHGEALEFLSDDVAYVRLDALEEGEVGAVIDSVLGTKALVIDIRGYPRAFAVFSIGQRLVNESTPFVRFTSGDLANPGAFHWTEPLYLEPVGPRYEGRVVVLVDHFAQSQSEYTTMAFSTAPGALVVGSTTAGADGNVSRYALPGGHGTMVSGIGVFYPDRTPTQRVGIIPDVEIRPTIAGIRAGRDEVLEEALRQVMGSGADEAMLREMARRR